MYDFDSVIDRRATFSSKWDVKENELPLSMADMDFATAPEITAALARRLSDGRLGYTDVPPAWNAAYVHWWKTRHGVTLDPAHLFFVTGVVAAISAAVRKLTTPNENVVLLTPVYNIFFNCIENNGRRVRAVPLLRTGDTWEIDWNALKDALSDPQSSLMLFCNPHNPVGRIWTKEELARLCALCKRHHVVLLSDEIHCDLCDPGTHYVPLAAVEAGDEIGITCMAPTKTFSIPGLQTAAVMSRNPVLRHRLWREVNTGECGEPNAFAMAATIAAYESGAPWLDAARDYIAQNKRFVRDFIEKNIPGLRALPGAATYLMWLDCRAIDPVSSRFAAHLRRETGLILTPGAVYGEGGAGYLRLNTACPRALLTDGMARLMQGAKSFQP